MDYNLIEFWNSCDLGLYIYQNGFKQRLFFPQDLGIPEWVKEEEGNNDGEGQFQPSFQKIKKTYVLDLGLVPEFVVDALELMQIHDTKRITTKDGDTADMQDVSIEAEWMGAMGCFARVKIKFTVDFTSKTACCSNRTLCLETSEDFIDIHSKGDGEYTDPEDNGISVGNRVFFYDTNPLTGKYTGGLYEYTGDGWVEYTELNIEGTVIYQTTGGGVYLYFDGVYWIQYPLVNNSSEDGNDFTVLGFAPPDTLVYVDLNVDAKPPVTSVVINSNLFNVSGITFIGALSGGWTHIKATVHCYTHSCNYGYNAMDFYYAPP